MKEKYIDKNIIKNSKLFEFYKNFDFNEDFIKFENPNYTPTEIELNNFSLEEAKYLYMSVNIDATDAIGTDDEELFENRCKIIRSKLLEKFGEALK